MTDSLNYQYYKKQGAKSLIWYKRDVGIVNVVAVKENISAVAKELKTGLTMDKDGIHSDTIDFPIFTKPDGKHVIINRDTVLKAEEL